MGLIELLIAMVVLNVGLFAVVSVFSSATTAMGRAATISSATAVADKQMEIYKSLKNCAIWLDANTSPTNTTTFPAANSGSAYQADTKSYTDLYASPTPAPVAFFDKSVSDTAMGMLPWATNKTTQVLVVPWNSTIPTFCNPSGLPPASLTASTTPPLTATKAVQTLPGPDGVQYPVYTYIILTQPSGAAYSGAWVKQVTIVVRDPRNTARILARQTSLFDWTDGS